MLPAAADSVSRDLLERTRNALHKAFRGVADAARARFGRRLSADLPDDDLAKLRSQIDACLAARGGAASARARAAELGQIYLSLNEHGRRRFFWLLAENYGADDAAVSEAIEAWTKASGTERAEAAAKLKAALDPPRLKLLAQFNGLEGGIKFLVDLRGDLMREARSDPRLTPVDRELHELLSGWFDIGFLVLQRIDWNSPAALLEKLIAYEAVHEIRSWADLKNRLDSDRRCYAFFHPSMPGEPLIFVEIALVDGLVGSIHALLDEAAPRLDPKEADTAIFYSISNAQPGLSGVGFGDFLIKRVVADLSRDLPQLKTFATLSPIPGLVDWLRSQEIAVADQDEAAMMRHAARYLLNARRNGQAHDRVAHFHLTNGARVERLNWRGDVSAKGMAQSAGIMVNYRYRLSDIETNHENYRSSGVIACTSAVRELAEG